MKIITWEDLAEKTIFCSLKEKELNDLGLVFKRGKNFESPIEAFKEPSRFGGHSTFSFESMVAVREKILCEFLEGNLQF